MTDYMYRTTTWKSCSDTTILYTTLHFAPSKRATKLRLLRHDTASKAVLAILRRKFKPTPRSTTRSRLQPTARNNVVGTIPHTAWLTLYTIPHDTLYEMLHDRTAASISHSIAFVSLTYDTVPKEKRALLKKKGTANVRVEKATAQSSDNGFGRTRHRATILLRASLQRALLQRALKVTHLPLVSATLLT